MWRWRTTLWMLGALALTGAGARSQPFNPCEVQASGPTPAVRLETVAGGFDRPVFSTHAGDGSDRLFVVEQSGLVRIVREGGVFPQPFLDIRGRVAFGGERGLLSVAFHPDYLSNGRFFVDYTARPDGRTVVAEYGVGDDPNLALPDERVVLEISQPFPNHNGGQLKFGPDGMLYVGLGDGGSGGDPLGHGQNPGTLLGSLLRLDVDGKPPYAVPPDNPLLDRPGARPEVYAYGLRNPWRFSFDRCDGRLFLADVGQNRVEEVNLIEPGGNYGWNTMEGDQCFPPGSFCAQGGLELPIATYGHNDRDGGFSATGGGVYRGTRFPELVSRYFFADFVSTRLWSLTEATDGGWKMQELLETGFGVSSFGEDESGELYLTGFDGGLYRLVQAAAPTVTAARALDADSSGTLNDAEILAAMRFWAQGIPVPDTDVVLDDTVIKRLVGYWVTGMGWAGSGFAGSPPQAAGVRYNSVNARRP